MRENIAEELHNHHYFSTVLDRPNVYVSFIGCVEQIRSKNLSSIGDLQRLYTTVYKLRESLLKIVFESEKQVKLIDLPMSSGLQRKLDGLFDTQFDILNRMNLINDFSLGDSQLKISEFANNVDLMLGFEGLLYDEKYNVTFQEMKKRVNQLRDKLTVDDAKRFVGKLIL